MDSLRIMQSLALPTVIAAVIDPLTFYIVVVLGAHPTFRGLVVLFSFLHIEAIYKKCTQPTGVSQIAYFSTTSNFECMSVLFARSKQKNIWFMCDKLFLQSLLSVCSTVEEEVCRFQ